MALEPRCLLSSQPTVAVSNLETTNGSYAIGAAPVQLTSQATISETDPKAFIQSVTVTISSNYVSSEDVLSYNNSQTPGITGVWMKSLGEMVLESSGATVAQYQAALRNVFYQDTNVSSPNTGTRVFSFQALDTNGNSAIVTRSFQIQKPVISNVETTTASFVQDSTPLQVTANLALSDTQSSWTTLTSATVKISANYVSTEDVLSYPLQVGNITGSWNANTGTLTLTGTDTLFNYQAALRSITYQDTNTNSPSSNVRQITFTVFAGTTAGVSASRYINIDDNVQNIETTTYNYTAGNTASGGSTSVPISNTLTIPTPAGGYLYGASVQITANYHTGEDVLSYATQIGNITGTFNSSTGTLTLTGKDTAANYQAALRSITYKDTSSNPTNGVRRFDIWTGTASAPSARFPAVGEGERYFSIQTHAAVISNIETATASFVQDSAPLQVTAAATLTDTNTTWTTVSSATVKISANYVSTEDVLSYPTKIGNITGSWNATTGTLTLTGTDTLANYQAALRSITYQDTNFNSPSSNVRQVTYTVFDGSTLSASASRYINIDDNVQNLETATYSYTSGNTAVPISNTLTIPAPAGGFLYGASVQITANYQQGQDVLKYPVNIGSITGTFNATTGTLVLTGKDTAADYQAALRSITYTNTSSSPTTGIRRFDIWTGTASAPSARFPAVGEGERYFSIQSHSAGVSNIETSAASFVQDSNPLQVTAAITVSDTSSTWTTITSATVKISGNYVSTEDVLSFIGSSTPKITASWNSTTGTLTLTGTDTLADYQTALRSVYYQNTNFNGINTNSRTITFNVFDGSTAGLSASRSITIDNNVQSVETTPYFYTVGSGAVVVTSALTLPTPSGGYLYAAAIKVANYVSGQDVLSYPTQIGNITGTFNTTTGTLVLTGKDTAANYQAALRSIKYQNSAATPTVGTRTFDIWTGTASTPPARYPSVNEGVRSFTVDKLPTVATAAKATPSPVTGTTTTLTVLGAYTTGESNLKYTWSVTGEPSGASPVFNANGTNASKSTTVTFNEAGSYTFKVTITDPLGGTVTSSVTVSVNQTVTSIKVTPANSSLDESQTKQLTATAYDQFANVMTVQPTFTWSNSGIGSVSSSGLYTAPASSTGTTTVKATSGTVSGTTTVTVVATVSVQTVAKATPSPVTGTTTTLTVLGTDVSGESTLIYTWAATSVPSGATPVFSVNGTNGAKTTVVTFNLAGNYTFRVTITDQYGGTVTSSVSVAVNQTVTSIVVTPPAKTIDVTQTASFTAAAYDQFGKALTVAPTFTWSATNGTVSSSGVFSGTAAGAATVKATSGTVSGSAAVTVKPLPTVATAAAGHVALTGLTAGLTVLGADVDGESTLTYSWVATTKPAGSTLFYSANGTNAAKNSTVTFSAIGTYVFKVTITDLQGGTVTSSTATVTVSQVASGVTISPTSAIIAISTTAQFSAQEYDQFGNAMTDNPSYLWGNSGTPGGTINNNGLYTASTTAGNETISVEAMDPSGSTFTASGNVRVVGPPTVATGAASNPSPVTGTTAAFTVLGADSYYGESNLKYQWALTVAPAGGTATFSANGTNGAKNTTVTFNEAGAYTFVVTITNPLGETVTSTLTVTVNATFSSIVVTPVSPQLRLAETEQFTATAYDQFHIVLSSQPAFTWSNTGVGSINSTGLYTAPSVGTGTATITASNGIISGSATATVSTSVAGPTVATAASQGLSSPLSTQLNVLGADINGESTLTYTWAATLEPLGATPVFGANNGTNAGKNMTVTFNEAGSYSFTVTIRDQLGQAVTSTVNVNVAQSLTSIVVTPNSQLIRNSQVLNFVGTGIDQFGNPFTTPPNFTWSSTGIAGGTLNASTGAYTAPAAGTGTITVTATSGSISGYAIDNVVASVPAPTVATAAAATPSPATGTTTNLSVLGADVNGESNLTYTWTVISQPAGPAATFSANSSNAAKNTTVTFQVAGAYSFQVKISDPLGQFVTSSVNVTVNQTLTSIAITPASQTLVEGELEQFRATGYDQFGNAMGAQPTFTWYNTGVGSVTSSGVYTAPASTTGTSLLFAASGSISGATLLTVATSVAKPTVATGASASPSTVTGTSTTLNVLGADVNGEGTLTYTWSVTSSPLGSNPQFSPTNGTNSGKNMTVTFDQAGSYTFLVTISDLIGQTVTSSVNVTVNQKLTSIMVTPASQEVQQSKTVNYMATAFDQFGDAMSSQPTFTWSASGVGTINSSTGVYTAPASTGSATITAMSGSITGTTSATIVVAVPPPTVATVASATPSPTAGTTTTLSVLGADVNGEQYLNYNWTVITQPTGAAPTFSANGSNAAKTTTVTFAEAGTYSFQVKITDPLGQSVTSNVNVTVSQTLTSIVIAPGNAGATKLKVGEVVQFVATGQDQFGNPMGTQPSFTWSSTGAGSITSAGVFTAPGSTGSASVTAVSGGISGSTLVNTAASVAGPTVATAASQGTSTPTTTQLNVLGADINGEGSLTYTWSVTSSPLGSSPQFNPTNGTNAGKNMMVTFNEAGTYTFKVTIADLLGQTTTSSVTVTVNQALTTITVGPSSQEILESKSLTYSAAGFDQFGNAMVTPPTFSWSVSGVGTINSSTGVYTAPASTGSVTVTASSSGVSGTASASVLASVPGPSVVTVASASPATVTGTTTTLNVLGGDVNGESNLTYTWIATIFPTGAAPVFGASNGTNAGKSTVATFSQAGSYQFQVKITDSLGQFVTSTVNVNVSQSLGSITVNPNAPSLRVGQTENFSAVGYDQFGNTMSVQPTFAWSVTGVGSINSSGVYTAPASSTGSVIVTAASGAVNGSTTASVATTVAGPSVATKAAAGASNVTGTTTTLSVLGGDINGESTLTYTWAVTSAPPGATPTISPVTTGAGTNAAKNSTVTFNAAGNYTFTATITDQLGQTITSSVSVVVQQTVTTLTVSPATQDIVESKTLLYTATGFDQFGAIMTSPPTITWSASGVGSIGTSTGLYTAPATMGTATITAMSGAASGTAVATIVATLPPPGVATPAAVSATPVTGTTATLTVLGKDINGESTLTYTWSTAIAPDGVAPVFSASNGTNAGKNTIVTFGQSGSYQFLVTIADPSGNTTTSTINVTVSQTLTNISVTPITPQLRLGEMQTFTATGYDQFNIVMGTQPTVNWSVTGVGSINSSGVYTAPASLTGTANITATSGAVSGSTVASVASSVQGPSVATGASAGATTVNGTSTTLSVLGADVNGESTLKYAWAATSVPPGATPTISPVTTGAGTNAAKSSTVTFNAAGNYTFTVTITDQLGQTVTSSVSVVVTQTVTTITVSPANQEILESKTQAYTATGFDQFGAIMTSPQTFTWSVSGVGSINSSTGVYTAPATTGSATITAKSGTAIGSTTATIVLTLPAPSVATAAAVSATPVTGTTAILTALGSDVNGESSLTYTWSTLFAPGPQPTFSASNGTNAGKSTTVTFGMIGSYQFQVTIADQSGNSVTSTINVTVSPTLTSIVVTPNGPQLRLGETEPFIATGYDQFVNPMSTAPTVTWTVTGVGSINSSGLYTAPASLTGNANITATSGAVSGSTVASVASMVPAPTVQTNASAGSPIVNGTSTTLSVLGNDVNGESTLKYAWAATSAPPGANPVFSATATNAAKNVTVTFNEAGNYTFTVTITDQLGQTITSSVSLTVSQTVTTITVAPGTQILQQNETEQYSASGFDQFGAPMTSPPVFTWSVSGGGSINSTTGLYTAPSSSTGTATITAMSASAVGTATATLVVAVAPPTFVTNATASSGTVGGTTVNLSALGADVNGESTLTYTWTVVGPGTGPTFSATNGTNAGKAVTATFIQAGPYTFKVTIKDQVGNTVSSTVNVIVNQTFTSIGVTPNNSTMLEGTNQSFTPTDYDQFKNPMASQPQNIGPNNQNIAYWSWGITGIGGVSATGVYTAPSTATGNAYVFASYGGITGSAFVTIASNIQTPTVALGPNCIVNPVTYKTATLTVLGADQNGESSLTYTWSATSKPSGANPTFSINGTNASKNTTVTFNMAGSYTFTVTITDQFGVSTSTTLAVTVQQTTTSILLTPTRPNVDETQTTSITATTLDQFGNAVTGAGPYTWSVNGVTGSSITQSGVYTASSTAYGTDTVTATNGSGVSGTTTMTVFALPVVSTPVASPSTFSISSPTSTLSVGVTDPSGTSTLIYTWIVTSGPQGGNVTFSGNGTNAASTTTATFNKIGTYIIFVDVIDLQGYSVASVSLTVTVTA